MQYLIDGYNLMHAWGILQGEVSAQALIRARKRFLDQLQMRLPASAKSCTVVFDAGKKKGSEESRHGGIRVLLATDHKEADDLIEELLEDSVIGTYTVVSNDRRLREAARRRKAHYCTCEEFMDLLLEDPAKKTLNKENEEEKPSTDDAAQWLEAFDAKKLDRDLGKI